MTRALSGAECLPHDPEGRLLPGHDDLSRRLRTTRRRRVRRMGSSVVQSTSDPTMITAVALAGYALALGLGAPRALRRFALGDRAPRRTIALLLILSSSLPLSAITGGLALGVTMLDSLSRIDPVIDNCADQLPVNDESPVAPMLGTMGVSVAGLLALWICYCLAATYVTAFLRARAHAAVLRVAGRPDCVLDAIVIQHDRAASYCLPGRAGRIVVTSKAIQLLTTSQLDAVLAHERAHQRGHHHLLLCLTTALRRAVPRVCLVRYADEEVRRLIEVIADDTAARTHGRIAVASALAVIGTGHVPTGMLGVNDGDGALSRITRMAKPAARLKRRPAALSALAVVAALVLPIVLAAVSIGVLIRHCPVSTDNESLPAIVTSRPGDSAAARIPFDPVD